MFGKTETIDDLVLRHRNAIDELKELEKLGWINKGVPSNPDQNTLDNLEHYMRIGCATDNYLRRIFNVSLNVTTQIRKTFKKEN